MPASVAALRQLPGVGPKVAEKLARLGIVGIDHLLLHLPRDYEDRTRRVPLAELVSGQACRVEGVVCDARVEHYRGRRLRARIADDSGGTLDLYFMRFSPFQKEQLTPGTQVLCYGEAKPWKGGLRMFHPEYEVVTDASRGADEPTLTPIYPATEGLAQISLRRLITRARAWARSNRGAVEHSAWEELFRRQNLPGFVEALDRIHAPDAGVGVERVQSNSYPPRTRLIVEELLAYHLSFRRLRERAGHRKALPAGGTGALFEQLRERLPFSLTDAQDRAIHEIRSDLAREIPMNRLLQGDVGSGKTLVAAAAALSVVESGQQVAVMAPTELLAEQHNRSLRQWLEPLSVSMAYLAGARARSTQELEKARLRGQAQVVVGTHALIQKDVVFRDLGLLIIDEQHRFGVQQRLDLRRKGGEDDRHPHQLIMTATPIPRSLAMMLNEGMDSSVLDEMPPGRLPVRTAAIPDHRRDEVIERIQVACGQQQQAYWVCTLIEESEALQCATAEQTAQTLRERLPGIEVALVHGRMKSDRREEVMRAFRAGRVRLLVATTVIEVGVDVPDASLMVIENAERLGLAQLHQLRGRVGRGARQSSCVLLHREPLTEGARLRIQAMRDTTDGFEIAERDLKLRGPGQLLGIRQAGEMEFRTADLSRDEGLLRRVREMARDCRGYSEEEIDRLLGRWLGEARSFGAV